MSGDGIDDVYFEEAKISPVPNLFLNEPVYDDYDSPDTPFHYLAKEDKNKYKNNTIRKIRIVYLISVVIWLVLIYIFEFYKTDWIGILILFSPIIVFCISFYHVEFNTVDVEKEVLGGNILSFVFLVVSILIRWSEVVNKRKILLAMMVSIVLIMGSLIDIWLNKKNMIILKHVRSIFNTTALVLLIYALYEHYSRIIPKADIDKCDQNSQEAS